jgi:2-polyprenyl-6-methoxyphenol hydroxylase-like FAD-dependent oxidoreductase
VSAEWGYSPTPHSRHRPVLVVGAGPVGATLALELARHGVPSTLIDRSPTAARHPKMDFVNARSMELFRRLGLCDEIRQLGVAPNAPFRFLWTRSLDEQPVARWDYPSVAGMREHMAAVNDGSMPLECYQRVLGSLLEDLGRRRAREHPLIDLREGWVLDGLEYDDYGVMAQVTDSGSGRTHQVRVRYVVGCDGANSTVRAQAGIGTRAIGPTRQYCDVYFRSAAPVLRRHGSFFLTICASEIMLVSRNGTDTFTGTFPTTPGEAPADPVEEIRARLGVDFVIDEVINVARWEGRLVVADSYRRGPVFLAGDAAHQFFPTGGHGANTGLADGVDLGWKLAAVINGWAGPRLLDSYDAERRPVALFNREMCFNLLEVFRRFTELARNGAATELLTGFLDQESYQVSNLGIHCGQRYSTSPVIWPEVGQPPPWRWSRIVPSTWPGSRAPSLRLSDGAELFDRLGLEFTLVDLSGENRGKTLVDEASRRGLPMTYLPIVDDQVRAVWERDLVLVRPDQHVAWRGNDAPDNWGAVLDRVRGC